MVDKTEFLWDDLVILKIVVTDYAIALSNGGTITHLSEDDIGNQEKIATLKALEEKIFQMLREKF